MFFMKICVLCSGVSEEKGISINSAKSIYEILTYFKSIESVEVVFLAEGFQFLRLKKEFLFANTVEDFLYKYEKKDIIDDYISYLKNFHLVFLTTHGQKGEDGYLQTILEKNNIPFIGPNSGTAMNTFNKHKALLTIWKNNICPRWWAEIFQDIPQVKKILHTFGKIIIKPNDGGSSIGVRICNHEDEALEAIEKLQEKGYQPLIEEIHEGVEFSVTVLQNKASTPTEIIQEGVFTYEKKYFPSAAVTYRNPANFPPDILKKISQDAEKIFEIFGCEHFLRVDGFYAKKKKQLIYTDINTIPGFQLNGLFFKNKSHFQVMKQLLNLPTNPLISEKKQKIFLIFGGDNSEQNISIISGGNILFNLWKDDQYEVTPFLLYKKKFWSLTYEESFQTTVKDYIYLLENKIPLDLSTFILLTKKEKATIFIGLHGGIGEDGTLQRVFEKENITYTGSNSIISKLCMNKYNLNEFIKKKIKTQVSIKKHLYIIKEILLKNFAKMEELNLKNIWPHHWEGVFIKPNDDGCSVGAMLLNSYEDFLQYHENIKNKIFFFNNIMMSLKSKDYLLSEYIKVDKVQALNTKIIYEPITFWLEGTIGVLGNKIFTPSLCLTQNHLLTMEEKFLHGTGTNLTPIPVTIMDSHHIDIIQKITKILMEKLELKTYCRMDFFYNIKTQQMAIIEVNTLPALTPATVLFQQAIQEGITPQILMNKIIEFTSGG